MSKNSKDGVAVDAPVRNFVSLHGILGPFEPICVWPTNDRKKIMRLYRSPSASVDALLTAMGLGCLDWSKAEKTRIGKRLGIPVANASRQGHGWNVANFK
jgi:hypothetical protein